MNYNSIKAVTPVGGDDINRAGRYLVLRYAEGDENFTPLGQPDVVEHPENGEIIYVVEDKKEVMCRRWNWRNADFSKITPETKNLAINVDGMLPSIGREELEEAADSLRQLLERFCGGSIGIHYLDKQNPEIEVPVI